MTPRPLRSVLGNVYLPCSPIDATPDDIQRRMGTSCQEEEMAAAPSDQAAWGPW